MNIENILNQITDLKTQDGVIVNGYFVKPGSNIWFNGRIKTSSYLELGGDECRTLSLSGHIAGIDIYIETASIPTSSSTGMQPEYIAVNILPNEIVLGIALDDCPVFVERIEADIPELNWFFGSGAVVPEFSNKEENYVARYVPCEMVSKNGNSTLTISRLFGFGIDKATLSLSNINRVAICFEKPVSLTDALGMICKARLLICFLADDFVVLPCKMDFETIKSQMLDGDIHGIADKTIWLNDNRLNQPIKRDYPFRLEYNVVKDCFTDVWNGWLAFSENQINQPMTSLFYEIISNKSVGLNRFLNICQALEVYSTQHRMAETKAIFDEEKCNKATTDKKITLRIRLKDLFQFHADVIPVNDICLLSQEISDIRNYYTHYNPEKKELIEAQYNNIKGTATMHEGTVYLLLLATVYKAIGIPIDVIKGAMYNAESRFGISTQRLFEGPGKDELPY